MERTIAMREWRDVNRGAPEGVPTGRAVHEFAQRVESMTVAACDRRHAAEIAALRKDAERYRKLVASGKYCAAIIGGGWGLGGNSTRAQLDAAVDALPAVGAA